MFHLSAAQRITQRSVITHVKVQTALDKHYDIIND